MDGIERALFAMGRASLFVSPSKYSAYAPEMGECAIDLERDGGQGGEEGELDASGRARPDERPV